MLYNVVDCLGVNLVVPKSVIWVAKPRKEVLIQVKNFGSMEAEWCELDGSITSFTSLKPTIPTSKERQLDRGHALSTRKISRIADRKAWFIIRPNGFAGSKWLYM